jgi:hypothetical protein
MPNSVLIPVGLYWIIGVTMIASAGINIAADGMERLGATVFLGTVGVACLVVAVGLQRRWPPAQLGGYLLALLPVLASLLNSPGVFLFALALTAILGVNLSMPSTKEWMAG